MGNCQNFPTDENKKTATKMRGKPQVIIKTFTWPRDSHGLFDYESKNLSKKSLKTNNTGKIARNGNDIHLYKENDNITNNNEKELMKLMIKDGNYWVSSAVESNTEKKDGKGENIDEDWEKIDQSVWLVVKSFKPNVANRIGYKLTEGDLIKLGRVKFRIREMRGSANIAANKGSNKGEKHTKIEDEALEDSLNIKRNSLPSMKDSVSGSNHTCRICLSDSPEIGNPFFSPCHCAGTMRYVHVKCLQKWLKSKLHTKVTGNATSIYWKTLECELCKKQFSNSFEVDGLRYDIVEIEKPDTAYIILEILSKEKNITRGVHVIKMESKNNIRLGRGHDSDIRITDISVSRCHALIKLEKGCFYIEDNNSKFGTLVHMKKPFSMIGDYNNISVQIGRTVVALTVKRNWRLLPACFSNAGDGNTSGDEREESGEDILFDEPRGNAHGNNNGVNSVHINSHDPQNADDGNGEGDDALSQGSLEDNSEEVIQLGENPLNIGIANVNANANANANANGNGNANANANPINNNNHSAESANISENN